MRKVEAVNTIEELIHAYAEALVRAGTWVDDEQTDKFYSEDDSEHEEVLNHLRIMSDIFKKSEEAFEVIKGLQEKRNGKSTASKD
jgi:hypothetical protein